MAEPKANFKKLPKGTILSSFKHCSEPLEMVMGQIENDPEDDNYQTYASCRVCKIMLLVKAGPWDSVDVYDGTKTAIQ